MFFFWDPVRSRPACNAQAAMLKLFALKSRYFDFYTVHEQFPFMKVRLWHKADLEGQAPDVSF